MKFFILALAIWGNYGINANAQQTRTVAEICSIEPIWTLVSDAQNCHKFYVCIGQDYEEFYCRADYHFSSTAMRCVQGPCNTYVDPPQMPQCEEYTVERYEHQCTSYKRCLRGAYILERCHSGYYFDASIKSCLPIEMTAQQKCSCLLPEHATLENPENCATYYMCVQGVPKLQYCSQARYYDHKTSSCLPDTTGKCWIHHNITVQPSLSEKEYVLLECKQTNNFLVPHATSCNKYYLCLDKHMLQLNCPEGKYFDATLHYCRLDVHKQCERVRQQ